MIVADNLSSFNKKFEHSPFILDPFLHNVTALQSNFPFKSATAKISPAEGELGNVTVTPPLVVLIK